MEPVTETVFSPAKVARVDNDYSLCIICQTKTSEALVVSPTVHEHVLDCVRELATYGDRSYPEISRRLGDVTWQELQDNSASWHRQCYQNTVHVGMRNRAKEKYEKRISLHKVHQGASASQASGAFTRSSSKPYQRELCFFCDAGATRTHPLHLLATGNASVSLKKAIEKWK